MSESIKRFTYLIEVGPEDHASPVVKICHRRGVNDEKGQILFSPKRISASEIDAHINELVDDLEILREYAKQALKSEKTN